MQNHYDHIITYANINHAKKIARFENKKNQYPESFKKFLYTKSSCTVHKKLSALYRQKKFVHSFVHTHQLSMGKFLTKNSFAKCSFTKKNAPKFLQKNMMHKFSFSNTSCI